MNNITVLGIDRQIKTHKKDPSLPIDIIQIIRHQATECPHTGEYNELDALGSYLCRGCGGVLFRSHNKFHASCGWPSFDDAIQGNVLERPDADGQRTEILCQRCLAHLGHIFVGEGLTPKNKRYCVNSKSLDFVPHTQLLDSREIILATGCFWGVQYYLDRLPGVVKTEVGYTGGHTDSPSYEAVCSGSTGHFEATRVLYDPSQLEDAELLKYFFEIHDPTQANGQGPDRGQQYQSAIFYYTEAQKAAAETLMAQLQQQNLRVATQLFPVSIFWPAEDSHQKYYEKHGQEPYCHIHTKRFS